MNNEFSFLFFFVVQHKLIKELLLYFLDQTKIFFSVFSRSQVSSENKKVEMAKCFETMLHLQYDNKITIQ